MWDAAWIQRSQFYPMVGSLLTDVRALQALFNLANLQRQCGEFEDAVRSYERVVALSPDSWRGLLNYSRRAGRARPRGGGQAGAAPRLPALR